MKCCKVIGTYFSNNRIDRPYHRPDHEDVCWSTHIQFGVGPHGVLAMLKDIVSLEKNTDAGVDMDTIIVNSDNGFLEGNKYLNNLQNLKTKNGKIIVVERENIGGQFGGYNVVYQKFKNDYDFWLFTEDDIIITGYEYYKKLIAQLGSRKNNTAYALIGVVDRPDFPRHACSACMLIYKTILKKVDHIPYPIENDIVTRIHEGEIAFSTAIYNAGFQLVYEGPGIYLVTKEWPFKVDYCLPYRQLIDENGSVNNFLKTDFMCRGD